MDVGNGHIARKMKDTTSKICLLGALEHNDVPLESSTKSGSAWSTERKNNMSTLLLLPNESVVTSIAPTSPAICVFVHDRRAQEHAKQQHSI